MTMPETGAGMATIRALLAAGKATAAVEQATQLLEVDPQRLDALILLGHAFIRMGRFDQARVSLERANQVSPDDIGILHALGGACHQVGLYDKAQAYLEKATRHNSQDPRLWYSLGLVRHAAGYFQAAIEAYDHALENDPGNADALAGKGKVLQVLGQLDPARAVFDAALERDPDCVPARVGLATQLEMEGRIVDAVALLEPVVGFMAANPELAFLWSRLLAQQGRNQEARVVIESLLNRPTAEIDRSHGYFTLGDLHDAEAGYEAAARCYVQANRTKPGKFDPIQHERRIAALIAAWSESDVAAMETSTNHSERPVFIVGMPRSGTSLVEQILGSHPSVHAAGELSNVSGLARQWQREDGVVHPTDLRHDCLSEAGEDYLGATDGPDDEIRVTDKMPSNFQHLGLIQALFGKARIVHCRRDPVDTALSCFFQDFSGLGLAWCNDLEDIAIYHRCYRQLMAHWKSVLNIPILDIEYERLVGDPEIEAKRLLEFIGLPWDPACLDFHNSRRVVATASNRQVRERIYRTSVGRGTNYRPYINIPADLERDPDG